MATALQAERFCDAIGMTSEDRSRPVSQDSSVETDTSWPNAKRTPNTQQIGHRDVNPRSFWIYNVKTCLVTTQQLPDRWVRIPSIRQFVGFVLGTNPTPANAASARFFSGYVVGRAKCWVFGNR